MTVCESSEITQHRIIINNEWSRVNTLYKRKLYEGASSLLFQIRNRFLWNQTIHNKYNAPITF
jgi:hypothetical protein